MKIDVQLNLKTGMFMIGSGILSFAKNMRKSIDKSISESLSG